MAFDAESLGLRSAAVPLLRDLIHDRTGLTYDDNRLDTMADRLAPLVAAHHLDSFLDYFYYLKYDDRPERLCADYNLYSFDHNVRIRLKVRVTVEDPRIPSVTGVWPGANFPEREAYDFFGIRFEGHPNLVRIHMPEDWKGYPQRKDYPLGGVDVEYIGAHIPPPDTRRYKGGWTST